AARPRRVYRGRAQGRAAIRMTGHDAFGYAEREGLRMAKPGHRLLALLSGGALVSVLAAGAALPGYHVLKRLQVGGTDRWAYVTLKDNNEIVELDSRKLSLTRRFPLKPCTGPAGLAMDTRRRRLFSACQNKMMVVVDANSGKVVATPPIGAGADAAGFDPLT